VVIHRIAEFKTEPCPLSDYVDLESLMSCSTVRALVFHSFILSFAEESLVLVEDPTLRFHHHFLMAVKESILLKAYLLLLSVEADSPHVEYKSVAGPFLSLHGGPWPWCSYLTMLTAEL
jgi:hypothetical protein